MDMRIEELSLSGWPALQTEIFDGWILRFAEGYSKRSNSVSPLYPSSLPMADKIAACEAAYSSRGLPTIFKILDSDEQLPIDLELEARGYSRLGETVVRVAALPCVPADRGAGAIRTAARVALDVAPDFGEAWIEAYCSCGRKEGSGPVIGRILGNVGGPRIVAALRSDGAVVACGYGAVGRGCVGVFDIVVAEAERRRGFGELLVRGILDRAAELGAGAAYLQVVSGNAPAERLYDRLGFVESYRYWYRRKGS